MALTRQQFMYKQSLLDFAKLKENIGSPVKINYLRDGNSINSMGTLKDVKDFDYILYTGGVVNFVGRDRIIRQISNTKGDVLYDRTYIIPSNAIIGSDISKYKREIMGAEQVKKFIPNTELVMHQDT